MFQFLLGRLKTGSRNPSPEATDRFQFLLGRLKTGRGGTAGALASYGFQFLLGRLKTNCITIYRSLGRSFNSC